VPGHFFAFEIGFDWVCFGILLALFGFVLALIGFELALFSPSFQLDLFLYSLVITGLTFIRASGKLALFCIKELICKALSTSVKMPRAQ